LISLFVATFQVLIQKVKSKRNLRKKLREQFEVVDWQRN